MGSRRKGGNVKTSYRAALTGGAAIGCSLAMLSGMASAGPVTWTTGNGGNGHSYELVLDNGISWTGAQAFAAGHGGYLVTEQTPQEAAFVNNLLATSNAPTGSYWIGVQES